MWGAERKGCGLAQEENHPLEKQRSKITCPAFVCLFVLYFRVSLNILICLFLKLQKLGNWDSCESRDGFFFLFCYIRVEKI